MSKLKEVHALRLEEILDWICFMETNNASIVDDPSKWDIKDLRQWRRDGRPTNVTIQTRTNPSAAAASTTTAQDKQQKIDDDMLSSWKQQRKDIKDYPTLEADEYYTEWYIQIKRQIKVDG